MAIDTSLYMAVIPAATYAVGDKITLTNIRGPAVVRDGYGSAILKRVMALCDITSASGKFVVHVKNSNWVDEMSNPAVGSIDTVLGNTSGAIQPGHDCDLYPNSGWEVYAVCVEAVTIGAAFDIFALIDIDYPRVQAVQNPRIAKGTPTTVDFNGTLGHTTTQVGSGTPTWSTHNLDVFKAGSRYLLVEASFMDGSNIGFMSISGAAGQNGLERIIPCRTSNNGGMKYFVEYATPLVKGPMNLNLCSFAASVAAVSPYIYMDYVKG